MSIRRGNQIISGGGSSPIDNKTITKNSDHELQTIGVINQNLPTVSVKTWTGTKAEYDAIVTKDANTLYNITDDTDVSLTILEALYPVGSIYETTNATCPLARLISGSTWVEETSRVLVDKGGTGTEWWELYSDGWCRQGGRYFIATTGTGTITFHKAFADTNYNIFNCKTSSDSSTWNVMFDVTTNWTTSSITIKANLTGYVLSGSWQAEGYTSTTTTHKRFRRTA